MTPPYGKSLCPTLEPPFRNHALQHGEAVPLCAGSVHLRRRLRLNKRPVNAQSRTFFPKSPARPGGCARPEIVEDRAREFHAGLIGSSAHQSRHTTVSIMSSNGAPPQEMSHTWDQLAGALCTRARTLHL